MDPCGGDHRPQSFPFLSFNNTVVVLLPKICLWEKQGFGKEYRLSSCRTRDPFGGVKEEKAATRKYNINTIRTCVGQFHKPSKEIQIMRIINDPSSVCC